MNVSGTVAAIAAAAGLAAGIAVTGRLHNDPGAGRWGVRLGSTRLRYANLPVVRPFDPNQSAVMAQSPWLAMQ
ncbi:MAG: hypothetical protein M3O91_03340 [Chloroflexota bacterium]|nr:hypothetical protein [Chloroflexota bacterium]